MGYGEMRFLKQLDKAAEQDKFPLIRQWMDDSPREFFAELRAERPILETSVCTLVAGYNDVVNVLQNPSVFTVQLYQPKMGDYMLAQDDTPQHFREKAMMRSMLNRDDLPAIRQMVADDAAEALAAAGNQIEYVNDFCRLIPGKLVQKYFGLNGNDVRQLIDWSYHAQLDTFHNQPFNLRADSAAIHQQAQQSAQQMATYLTQLVQRRIPELQAGDTATDVVARLLRTQFDPAVGISMERLVLNIGGLLIGTIETTSQAVAQIVQYLLRHADAMDMARQCIDDTTAFDAVVWEALRFDPISPYLFRKTAGSYTLGRGTKYQTEIRDGTLVLPLTLSAMFDPLRYPDAESFNPQRSAEDGFQFGFGLHECLGKYVGMAMIPEMVRQTLRCPQLSASQGIDYQHGPFPERYLLNLTS